MDRREIIIPVRSQTNGRSWCLSITRAADFSPFKLLPADNSTPLFPSSSLHFIDTLPLTSRRHQLYYFIRKLTKQIKKQK